MKRILSLILTMVIMLTTCAVTMLPSAAAQENDFSYTAIGDRARITDYTGIGGNVVIPSYLGGYPVVAIEKEAFANSNIVTIEIPDSVTYVGDAAFSNCISLRKIALPDGLTYVGTSMFSGCTALTSVTLPNGISVIPEEMFSGCSALNDFIIPETVTSIGDSGFRNCSSLKNIEIPNSVTNVGSYAFSGCTSLKNVTIPGNLKKTSEGMFYNCTALTEVTIQDGVTIIGGCSFQNCTSLQKVSLPKSITTIYFEAFEGCSSLTDLILPENLQTIGNYAFRNCTSLNKIVIPNNVRDLGAGGWEVFSGCTSLYTVILLSSSLSISNSCFDDCISLTEMYIPESIYQDVCYVLDECSNLTLFNNYNRYTTGVTVVQYDCNTEGHLPSQWVGVQNGSCADGSEYIERRFCLACGAIVDEHRKKIEHDFSVEVITQEPSCTEVGKGSYECAVCGANDGSSHDIPALGHNLQPDDDAKIVEPTCTQTGSASSGHCTRCDYTEKNITLPALGHDYQENRIEPGFSHDGAIQQACTRCGDVKSSVSIPKLQIYTRLADVTEGQWFTPYIAYCLDTELMKGQGDKDAAGREYFRPENSMTRAELVTVLYNMEGQPPVQFEAIFDDVTSEKWFAAQVTWASQNGLVFGTADKIFEPDTPISRQDLAMILYRYAVDYKGIEMNVENVDALLGAFSDADRVGNYAKVAMAAMNQAGVITGDGDRLKPQENATRAEVASMLSRYLPNVLQADQTNGER